MKNSMIKEMVVMESVQNFCDVVRKGTLGINIVSVTIPKMRKTNNPFYGRVHKAKLMTNVGLGYNYKKNREDEQKANGEEVGFTPKKPSGLHWVNFPFILQSDKDETKFYLRVNHRNKMKSKSIYLLDGKPCDAATLREIMQFISVSAPNTNTNVKPFNITIDNIMAISQGNKVFNRLNKMFTLDEIHKYFK